VNYRHLLWLATRFFLYLNRLRESPTTKIEGSATAMACALCRPVIADDFGTGRIY